MPSVVPIVEAPKPTYPHALRAPAQHPLDIPGTTTATHVPSASGQQPWTATGLRIARMMHVAERVVAAFNAAGIPVMALKGAALHLALYRRPEERPMDDLDLMIRSEDAGRAVEVLDQLGALQGEPLLREDFFPRYHYEREFIIGRIYPVKIDLHVRPFRPLRYARCLPVDAFWGDAREVRFGRARVLIPSAESMLIHLAVHSAVHGHARAAWLEDIRRWLVAHAGRFDWTRCLVTAGQWRLVEPLRDTLRHLQAVGEPVTPPEVLQSLEGLRSNWRDRLVLRHAPRDAANPLGHVLVDTLCTPGWRFVAGYLRSVLFPGEAHMGDLYPWRHRGWLACAHLLRMAAPLLKRFPTLWHRFDALELKSSRRHGVGVFACRTIRPGECFARYHGRPTSRHGQYTGCHESNNSRDYSIELTGKLRYLNHSCRPNARLQGRALVALRMITDGDEVTIDYGPHACNCRREALATPVRDTRNSIPSTHQQLSPSKNCEDADV